MRRATRPLTILLPLLAVAALAGCGGGGGAVDDIASLGTTADEADEATTNTSTDTSADTSTDASDSDDGNGGDGGGDGPGRGMVVMQSNAASDDPEVQDAFVRYSRCMREHGIDMPDPGASGEATRIEIDDPDAWEDAEEECRPIIEEVVGTFEPPSEEEQARMREQALEFSKCMREHGIDMPDPQFSEDGGVMINVADGDAPGGGAGPGDDDFQAAAEECGEAEGGMVFSSDDAESD